MPQMYGGFTQETYPYSGGYMMPPYMSAPVYPMSHDAGLDVPPHMQGISPQPPMFGVPPKGPTLPPSDTNMQQQIPASNEVQKSSTDLGRGLKSLETKNSDATEHVVNHNIQKPLPTTLPSSVSEGLSKPEDTHETKDVSDKNVSIDDRALVQSQTKPMVQERKPKTVPGAAPGAVVASRDPSVPESDFDFEKANSLFQKHSRPDADKPNNNERIPSVPSAPSSSFYDSATEYDAPSPTDRLAASKPSLWESMPLRSSVNNSAELPHTQKSFRHQAQSHDRPHESPDVLPHGTEHPTVESRNDDLSRVSKHSSELDGSKGTGLNLSPSLQAIVSLSLADEPQFTADVDVLG